MFKSSTIVEKAPQLKGHEAYLKALEGSGAFVDFVMTSSGEHVLGKIKTSDRYTISVMCYASGNEGHYRTRVLFKHDISEFSSFVSQDKVTQ